MMTIPHADSEISDGTPPEFADSSRAAIGFYKKEIFSDRGDKKRVILPQQWARKFVREDSDALGRFITWGIEIYNQVKGLSMLRIKQTIDQFRKQGGARQLTLCSRRAAFAALTPLTSGAACGSTWSLSAMAAYGHPPSWRMDEKAI